MSIFNDGTFANTTLSMEPKGDIFPQTPFPSVFYTYSPPQQQQRKRDGTSYHSKHKSSWCLSTSPTSTAPSKNFPFSPFKKPPFCITFNSGKPNATLPKLSTYQAPSKKQVRNISNSIKVKKSWSNTFQEE